MNVRLIKPGMSFPDQKNKQATVEAPIIDTIRSWVRDFQSTKANRAQLEFERISNPAKTWRRLR